MIHYPPYIYEPAKSIEVLEASEQYLEAHPDLKEKVINLGWCYQSIGKSIPQTTENWWSGHFFPFIESSEELQISFNLAMFGLYKQAFMSLRSALEVGMLSVYYNINDDGHKTIQDWLKSKDTWEANTPRADKIWKILNSNTNISRFNSKFNLKGHFDDLNYLHNYVHTKGYKYSNHLGVAKPNYQTFEESILFKWIDTYGKVAIIIITLHMLKYPITSIEFDWRTKVGIDNPFPVLEAFEIDQIREILPFGYFDEIRNIASNDYETQELYKHIVNIPDMTEAEKERQIIDLDKMLIEHGQGFIEWEKQHLYWLNKISDEEKDKILHRIEVIRKWAEENNMMKPKLERIKEEGVFNNSTTPISDKGDA
jgi:hypothetical protein